MILPLTLCKHYQSAASTMYDIREHLSVLTPAEGSKTKYKCPACGGNNLGTKPKTTIYACFNGCSAPGIRVAIDKLEGKSEWKPEPEWVKPNRPKSQKEYFYPDRNGNPLVKVLRIDHGDGSKKDFPQSHWDGGKWLKSNPDEVKKLIPIYRRAEALAAIERNELIFWVEGESTADLLWDRGIAATTTIGGSGGYSSYGNYQQDLAGARLVLAPDRDSNGLKYIANIERDFPKQIEGYYLAGTVGLWKKPAGGMDIGDDILDRQLTKTEILEKVIPLENYQQISKSFETNTSQGLEGADKQSATYQQLSALSANDLKERVGSIVERGLTGADRESALVALAAELRVPKQSLEGIYQELERATDRSADNADIEKILSAQRHQLSPIEIFPDRIATKIEQIAKARGTNCEPLMLGLKIAASSVSHANTRLNVANHGDVLSIYPNLFGMNVGDSGSLKSPTNGTSFTKPLRALQKTYIDEYEIELQGYEAELQTWEKQDKKERGEAPKPPRLVVVLAEDATMEKIEDLALHQPTICPGIYRDELIGIFQAFDKHGGKGSNDSRAKLLSYYDGSPINIHRVGTGSKISRHDYHPVVFGGIQPEVLKDLARSIGMDNDGTLCRFLYAPVNRQYKAWDEDPDTEKIDTDVFNELIKKIHNLPAIECSLDADSQKAWAKVANHYNQECLNNPRLSSWLKHAYSKAIGQLGKIALTLHLIECAESDRVSAIISKQTIEKAALALDYFISQSIALIASTEETLEAHLVRILDKAKKLGTIKPREVQAMFSGKKRIDSTTARNYLDTLADSGYGSIDDKGVFTPKTSEPASSSSADNADKVLITYQQPESTPANDLNNIVDNADKNNQSNFNGVNRNKNTDDSPIISSGNRLTAMGSTVSKLIKVGDRVKYVAGDKALLTQYAGILEVYEIRGDSYTCLKPDGSGLTSWIEFTDLQFAEGN
jgi:Protein of unknown function (DUF3987)